ncbi:TetR family transcriptional regulator [Mycolicibacterium insubricum]|uniref:Uncharacterized protein n=1 Tax=Mycolicibacterium insubricum TaxID=444597 RepID=A0A1X0D4J8_9MYCO|nr:hypothetical protein [Mycolicibacterium insubricum]ORA67334.1 hypothetical protein BST26_15960 [Mycolicibacterium insubricum]BBZ68156.1 TetR family transcriptional regulator [Mycolicibacterium insubricum]
MLGNHGSRGLSHPKVDAQAGLPAGTASYYFRTRQSLLHAIAARVVELDVADLSMLTELGGSASAGGVGASVASAGGAGAKAGPPAVDLGGSEPGPPAMNLADDGSSGYSGTRGLAALVMLSGTEPWLTRTRARLELMLLGRNDPTLAEEFLDFGTRLYGLARDAVAQWQAGEGSSDGAVPVASADEQAVLVLTYISGVMMTFVHGMPVVTDVDRLDGQIRQILRSGGT